MKLKTNKNKKSYEYEVNLENGKVIKFINYEKPEEMISKLVSYQFYTGSQDSSKYLTINTDKILYISVKEVK